LKHGWSRPSNSMTLNGINILMMDRDFAVHSVIHHWFGFTEAVRKFIEYFFIEMCKFMKWILTNLDSLVWNTNSFASGHHVLSKILRKFYRLVSTHNFPCHNLLPI
jgi:hypothetical protein